MAEREGRSTGRTRCPARGASTLNARVVAAALAASIGAAWTPAPLFSRQARDEERISLNGDVTLKHLVDLCSERLDLNVEYDPRALEQSVTLRVGDPLTNDELWSVTNHLLASRGLTTIRTRDGYFSVVKTDTAPWLGTINKLDDPGTQPGFVTVAVRINSIPVDKAVEALKFILAAGTSHVVPMPPTNVLLLTDLRPRVERAVELLDLIDQPIEDVSIELGKSGSVGAATLAQSATDILQARDGVTGRSPKGRVVALPDGSGVAIVAVIQIRTQDVLSEAVGAAVVDVLEEHAEALRRGALVTILNQASRVRILPVLP